MRIAMIAMPSAVICMTANPERRPIAVIVKRATKLCVWIFVNSQRMKRAVPEKINTAPAKLKPTHRASFQSRAAIQIRMAQVIKARIATQTVAKVASSNSFRISRIGEILANPNSGGPANANNKTQVNITLHKTGAMEIDGKLPIIRLLSKPVSSSWTI